MEHSRKTMQGNRFGLICSLFAFTTALTAAEPEEKTEQPITLEECIQLALSHNLDIQIARMNPDISLFDIRSTAGAYDPTLFINGGIANATDPPGFDPTVGEIPGSDSSSEYASGGLSGLLPWGTSYRLGANIDNSEGIAAFPLGTNLIFRPFQSARGRVGALTLRQPLMKDMWIDSTRYQLEINRQNLEVSELALSQQIQTTVSSVESAYYNLIYAFEQVKVQQMAVELALKLLAENRKRVEVGAMAPLDEKQAESDAAGRQSDLISAKQNLTAAQNILKNLLTDEYAKYHNIKLVPGSKLDSFPVTLNLQESWMKGLTSRPDLLQARVNVAKFGTAIRFQKNQLFPRFDVVGTAGYNAFTDEGPGAVVDQWTDRSAPFTSIGAEFSIPLGNRTARNNYKSTKHQEAQAKLQLKKLEQNILVEIDNAIEVVRSSLERIRSTREARVFAEAALDAEQKKLENGKSTGFEVLRLQRDLTTARSMEIRALADYNIAVTELAYREGATLERHELSLVIR